MLYRIYYITLFMISFNCSNILLGMSINSTSSRWIKDYEQINDFMTLPLKARKTFIPLPEGKILLRAKKQNKQKSIEPLSLKFTGSKQNYQEIMNLAATGKESLLLDYLKKNAEKNSPTSDHAMELPVADDLLELIDLKKISKKFGHEYYTLEIETQKLLQNQEDFFKILEQTETYLTATQKKTLLQKAITKENIAVAQDLLPSFARKVLGKYTIYEGPNCFHAALAFQNPMIPKFKSVNLQKEEGYHWAMINYDELWKYVSENFYPIDPAQTPLKYGDIFLFFDLPSQDKAPEDVDFHWIKHASTYLFGGYVFSKGSKSSNSPYVINKLKKEWEDWEKRSKVFAAKVFRKKRNHVSKPIRNLIDWLY